MSSIRRLDLLKNHLSSKFPSASQDGSLDDFRKRGDKIDASLLLKKYLGNSYDNVMKIRQVMNDNPIFNHFKEFEISREDLRGRVVQQIGALYFSHICNYEIDKKWPFYKCDLFFVMAEYDLALTTRLMVHMILYIDTLQNIGTQKHFRLIDRAYRMLDYGCFAMTELGHGSNVAKVETVASYDHKTREFIINSPTQTSAKW